MRWLTAVVAAALTTGAPAARADKLTAAVEAVEDAKRLYSSINNLVDLAYTLSNTEELARLPSMFYEELMRDPVMNEVLQNTARLYRGGFLRLDVAAGASTDSDLPGSVTGMVDASWDLPLCRVLGVRASGLAGYDGESVASWSLGGTACLPLPANTVEVSYARRSNVRGSLLQRPVVISDRRDEHVLGILIRFWRWYGEHNQIDVAPIRIDVTFIESNVSRMLGGDTGTFDIAPVDWRRRGKGFNGGDQVWRFLHVKAAFLDNYEDTRVDQNAVSIVSPLTVDGLRIADDVAVGADVGYARGAMYDEVAPMGQPQPPPLVQRAVIHTHVWADIALDPAVARIDVSHSIAPAYGDRLVLEDRASVRADLARALYASRLEGFVSRARILGLDERAMQTLYGGAADVAYAITPRVHAVGRVEGARALQASMSGEPTVVRWDMRGTLGLTAHFDRRW